MDPNLKNQFFLDPNIIFLNHGSFGACAKPVYDNLLEWQRILEKEPVIFFEETIFNPLKESREKLGNYINCKADDLVYFPNPTTAVNALARSLKLKEGDEVLSTNHIYGALDRTWKFICKNTGAKYIRQPISLPLSSKEDFLDSFIKGITQKTNNFCTNRI